MSKRNPRRLTAHCLLLTAFLLVTHHSSPITAFGQSATATLSGTVEDERGAVIPGATVTAVNTGTGARRQATTSDQGYFTIPLLPPSAYTVTVEQQGFASVEVKDVVLNVNDNVALNIQLKVGQIGGMTVTVNADANTIQETPEVATVVDRQFVANLPLNGRSFQSLISLTPGVVVTRATGIEQGQFSVNGQRADANYFTVDGVGANIGVTAGTTLGQGGGGALPGLTAFGGTNNLVSVDALQEFKIQTSTYAPEFGRTPGAQVQILTRSGSNNFSGTVFEYFRNEALDANDWFNNSLRLAKPALRQNIFGGVLGGPIFKNRTFFFFSYEGLRLRLPQTRITDVPSIVARQTAPTAVQPFLNAFPIPNGPNRLGANGQPNGFAQFAASFSNPSSSNATSIRIDHSVNESMSIFGRFNYAPSDSISRGGTSSLNTLAVTDSNTQTLTGGATWTITPKVVNDFRINWSRNKGAFASRADDFGGAVPLSDSALFPSPLTSEENLFGLTISGGTQRTLRVGPTATNLQRQVNVVNNLTFISGSHQVKVGVDYRRLFPIFGPTANFLSFVFSSVGVVGTAPIGSVISGRVSSAFILSKTGDLFPIFENFSVYGQDTWKATPRLTLTYGLRYEVNPAPSEANGNDPFGVTQVDDPGALTLAPEGTALYKTRYRNFAPRFGLAYQLFQQPGRETVLRGGVGIFYDLGTGPASNAFITFPYTAIRNVRHEVVRDE